MSKLSKKRDAEAVAMQPEANLGRGDSITVVGSLVGVFLVIISPPLWMKIPALLLVCVGCFSIARKSIWTHKWSVIKRNLAGIVAVLLVLAIGIPQFMGQWKTEHPASPIKYAEKPITGEENKHIDVATVTPKKQIPNHRKKKPLINPESKAVPPNADCLPGAAICLEGEGVRGNTFSNVHINGGGVEMKDGANNNKFDNLIINKDPIKASIPLRPQQP
jgi:hypothetical protein